MTREEVISILKRKSTIPDDDYCWDEIEEAFEMAIEAIENQKTVIEELEKIKDEILNLSFTGWADKPKLDREEVLTILNKYISELSGDNKQIICNSCRNNTDELSGECYECVKGIEDWYEPIAELKGE